MEMVDLKMFKYEYGFKNSMFLKGKAVFMIIVLIMSIFYVSFLNIEEVKAENNVCCEKTLNGEYCGERENVNECDIGLASDENPYLTLNNYCSEASFCNTGCCVPGDGSPCGKNSVEQSCIDLGGEFVSGDSLCTTRNECTEGCCMLKPFSCGLSTEVECQQDSLLYNIPSEWSSGLNEISCTEECLQVEKGCCVTGTGILPSHFSVTTSDSCNGEFHANMLCSNSQLASPCTEKHHTNCNPVDGIDVYWFDSCGNIENIVGVEGNGYFLDSGCGSNGNIENTSCGDCDYTLGSICSNGTMSYENAEHICVDLSCENTYNNLVVPWDGGTKQSGESWCEYEGAVGEGKDLVGSKHYVHSCFNNKEFVEECGGDMEDSRENICIQSEEDGENILTSATCRQNFWRSCFGCNNEDNPEECCNAFDTDCSWTLLETNNYLCHPKFSPSRIDSCDFSFGCPYTQKKNCVLYICSDWEVDRNKFCCKDGPGCENWGFQERVRDICTSMGDCGFSFNVMGEEGNGFYVSEDNEVHYNFINDFSKQMTPLVFPNIFPTAVNVYLQLEALESGISIVSPSSGYLHFFDLTIKAWDISKVGVTYGLVVNTLAHIAAAIAVIGGFILDLFRGLGDVFGIGPEYKKKTNTFTCSSYIPPTGADDCSKCTDQSLLEKTGFDKCTQYRCESLGLGCKFIENTCISYNINDAQEPIIMPLIDYLEEQGYEIIKTPSNTGNDGYEIKNPNDANGKFDVGDIINLGINTTDPPHNLKTSCKISKNHYTGSQTELDFYDLITNYFGAGWSYEHTMSIGYDFFDEENLNYEMGENTYYVHCKDWMDEEDGGPNIKTNYWIRFNVNEVDIMTPPIIDPDSYSLPSGSYIQYGANDTDISFNINIPGECRYSTSSKPFYEMSNGTYCYTQLYPGAYPCTLNLPIQDNANNYFFFKCNSTNGVYNEEDQPIGGLLLKGTIPLEISSVSPNNEVIYSSQVTLNVGTSAGAENGKAICYFKNSQDITMYNSVPFFNTDSAIHSQILNLNPDTYTYYILCQDAGGNQAFTNITFNVDTTNLTIVDVLPVNNSIIYVNNVLLQITTEGGKDNNGNSDCLYGENNANILITNKETVNQQTIHKKNLTNLQNKIYNYKIECDDDVKIDTEYLTFTVDMESVPSLIQVYTTYNLLNIVTDAPAICEYTNTGDFTFGNGTPMTSSNNYHHLANINSDVFYIKCKHKNTNIISNLYTIYI